MSKFIEGLKNKTLFTFIIIGSLIALLFIIPIAISNIDYYFTELNQLTKKKGKVSKIKCLDDYVFIYIYGRKESYFINDKSIANRICEKVSVDRYITIYTASAEDDHIFLLDDGTNMLVTLGQIKKYFLIESIQHSFFAIFLLSSILYSVRGIRKGYRLGGFS